MENSNLTFKEVQEAVGRLATDLEEALDYRDQLVKNAVLRRDDRSGSQFLRSAKPFATLVCHGDVRRIERKILGVIRQYGLGCYHCGKTSVFSQWVLSANKSNLICPVCKKETYRLAFHNLFEIEALFRWALVDEEDVSLRG